MSISRDGGKLLRGHSDRSRGAQPQGHEQSQFELGLIYHESHEVLWDVDRAIELYTKAGEQGDARAYWRTPPGVPLEDGWKNEDGAEKAYLSAIEADSGRTNTHLNFGILRMRSSLYIPRRFGCDMRTRAGRAIAQLEISAWRSMRG